MRTHPRVLLSKVFLMLGFDRFSTLTFPNNLFQYLSNCCRLTFNILQHHKLRFSEVPMLTFINMVDGFSALQPVQFCARQP